MMKQNKSLTAGKKERVLNARLIPVDYLKRRSCMICQKKKRDAQIALLKCIKLAKTDQRKLTLFLRNSR